MAVESLPIAQYVERINGQWCSYGSMVATLTRPPASLGWSNFANSFSNSLAVACQGDAQKLLL